MQIKIISLIIRKKTFILKILYTLYIFFAYVCGNEKIKDMTQVNTPYVKAYDSDGFLTNPIKGTYPNLHPNRRQRRQVKQKNRFHGESKNFHLTCEGKYSFARVKQHEVDKEGNKKVVLHYLVR